MSIEVRGADPTEYETIGKIVVEAFSADGQFAEPDSAFYAEVLRDVAGRAVAADIVVALDGDLVVGGVTFVPRGGPMADLAREGEAEIRMLGVAPGAQGRGVGTALMHECIARSAGSRRIVLSTQTVARGAHRLYERLGFVREPARDWAPVPGVDLLCYALEL